MERHVKSFVNRLCVIVVGFVVVCAPVLPVRAQSDVKGDLGLQVLSAEYVPATDTVQVRLQNNAAKAATAYGVHVKIMSEGNELRQFGYGSDQLNLVLAQRCEDFSESTPGPSATPKLAGGWNGAIKPGDIHTEVLAAGIGKTEKTQAVQIRAAVTGVIWEDGKVEGEGVERKMLDQIVAQRDEALRDEDEIVGILKAHEDDPAIMHRMRAVENGVSFLASIRPHVRESNSSADSGPANYVQSSPAISEFLGNLKMIEQYSPSKETFELYSSYFVCRHNQRIALQAAAKPGSAR